MLISLQIENFALIDRLNLELGPGLNVFTGETGAGKSIILDALDIALGGKVDKRAIRTGSNKALLEATFQLSPDLATWLETQEIELVDESLAICSREISIPQKAMRSRSRVNGVLVNRKLMQELRDRLVEITAQGQTVQMGEGNLQREWLDLYGPPALAPAREAVAAAYNLALKAKTTLENRRKYQKERLQRLDLLEYQTKELEAANLSEPEELETLKQESQRLSHVVELQQQSYQVYQYLYQNDNQAPAVADLLGEVEATLTNMVEFDSKLKPVLEMVSDALAQVVEASREISNYGEQLEADPQRWQEVEERISELKQICRKYGPSLAEAIAHYQSIQAELKELKEGDESLEALESAYEAAQAKLKEKCNELTLQRREAAVKLETNLVEELKPLAMEKVKFQVQIEPTTPTATGADQITFCFSPNPGEPLQPLGAIASGGEMSRFLLALKACFSQTDKAGTLVFDEIDVGVSGRVAGAIADKLYLLGRRHQVLCVTHQPLVAAMADRHFRVDKQVIGTNISAQNGKNIKQNSKTKELNGISRESISDESEVRTVVRVKVLEEGQRLEELAQLASGRSAREALAFAESLLVEAATRRDAAAQLIRAKSRRRGKVEREKRDKTS